MVSNTHPLHYTAQVQFWVPLTGSISVAYTWNREVPVDVVARKMIDIAKDRMTRLCQRKIDFSKATVRYEPPLARVKTLKEVNYRA